MLPYKDQKSANVLRRRLKDLSVKIGNTTEIVPVFINRKNESDLKHSENKPNVVNNQCVVYYFKCGLCDMDYIGYTTKHLYQRIEEHKSLSSSVGRHMKTKHDLDKPELKAHSTILKKCKSKFDCLVHENFHSILLIVSKLNRSSHYNHQTKHRPLIKFLHV